MSMENDIVVSITAKTVEFIRELEKSTQGVQKFERQTSKSVNSAEAMFARLEKAYDKTGTAARRQQKDFEILEKAKKDHTLTDMQLAKAEKWLNKQMEQTGGTVSKNSALMSTRGLHGPRAMGTAIQQAGYQFGDFAVQVASGQSAMTAFIQQGTQLISMFGPAGAVAGAVLAIGGAIYKFAEASEVAANSTEEYEEALQSLESQVKENIKAEKILRGLWKGAIVESFTTSVKDAKEQLRAAKEELFDLQMAADPSKGGGFGSDYIGPIFGGSVVGAKKEEIQAAMNAVDEAQKNLDKARAERQKTLQMENIKLFQKATQRIRNENAAALNKAEADAKKTKKKVEKPKDNLTGYAKEAHERELASEKWLAENTKKVIKESDQWKENQAEEAEKKLAAMRKKRVESEEEDIKRVRDFTEDAFKGMEDSLVDFVTKGELSFKNMADGIIDQMTRIMIQKTITGPLTDASEGIFGDIFGGFLNKADGGHIAGPGGPRDDVIPAMLSNGEFVVNARATRKNRGFLEAINSGMVPQRFADGGPVSAANTQMMKKGGGDTVVNIIDQRTGDKAPVETQETRGSDGRRQIAVMIRDTVRRGLSNGEFDGALNSRFGSTPATIRRG